jgi:prepilin-type N-terminal cleavage/methylation domain-containing protein
MDNQADLAEVVTNSGSAFLVRPKMPDRRKEKMRRAKGAFTLVEVLIVVVILGILALVIVPMVSGSALSAKESSLAYELHMLRRFALIYKTQHLEVGPGYPDGDTTQTPTEQAFVDQMTLASNPSGQTAAEGTPGFERGPYMSKIPVNPMNHLSTVMMLGDSESFPANADNNYGWVYKASTSEFRCDCAGTSSGGKSYYDY